MSNVRTCSSAAVFFPLRPPLHPNRGAAYRSTRLPLALVALAALLGCAGPSQTVEAANDHLAAADAAAARADYAEAVNEQRAAVTTARTIATEFPESLHAQQVRERSLHIGGWSIAELEEKVIPASELRVKAVSDLSAAAVFIALTAREHRDHTLSAVVAALAPSRPRAAEVAARWIKTPADRFEALMALSEHYRANKDDRRSDEALVQAAAAARSIDNIRTRWSLLEKIVDGHLADGRPDRAVTIARTIPDGGIRARALGACGDALAQLGRGKEASMVLGEALEAAEAVDSPHDQATAWVRLARTYALGGAHEGATELLDRFRSEADALTSPQKDPLLAASAGIYALMGRWPRAWQAIGAIDLPEHQAAAYVAIAADSQSTDGLQEALRRASPLRSDPANDAQGALLTRLGALAPDRAIAEASRVFDPATRARALAQAARERRDATLLTAARAAAADVYQDAERIGVTTELALALAQLGDLPAANTLLDEATAAALKGATPTARVAGLMAITETAIRARQTSAGLNRLRAAIHHAEQISDRLTSTAQLTQIATLAVQADAPFASDAIAAAARRAATLEFEGSRTTALIRIADLLTGAGSAPASTSNSGATNSGATNSGATNSGATSASQTREPAARALIEAARGIDDTGRREQVLRRVAPALAAAGHVKEASSLVSNDDDRAEVCALGAAAGQVDAALEIVTAIAEPGARARALAAIAARQSNPALSKPVRQALARVLAEASAGGTDALR